MHAQLGSVRDWKVGSAGVVRYGTGSAPTWQRTALRISRSKGSMVAGPREQLRPTTSAPAASSRRAVSPTLHPSRIRPSRGMASVITAGFPERRIASRARSASPPQL